MIEASALASLPMLEEAAQYIYTWFLIGFPPLLTVLFFITLNFNARALYSPSDYENQQHFLESSKAMEEQPACTGYNQLAIAARAASLPGESVYIPLPGGRVHVIDCALLRDRQHALQLLEKITALAQLSAGTQHEGQVVVLVNSDRLSA
jgi:hypothetical protein